MPPSYEDVKTLVQWLSFFFSILFNSLLVYLILTKSPKKMGNYRYLMIYFSCFAMFFSTLDVIVGPVRYWQADKGDVFYHFPVRPLLRQEFLCFDGQKRLSSRGDSGVCAAQWVLCRDSKKWLKKPISRYHGTKFNFWNLKFLIFLISQVLKVLKFIRSSSC